MTNGADTDKNIRKLPDDQKLPDDMHKWMRHTVTYIDEFNAMFGFAVAFLVVPIFVAMCYEIIARKFFLAPTLWAYDISRMLYGTMFMLGAAYTLLKGSHIRADFLYRLLSNRAQAIVDLTLYLLLYFPGLITFFWFASEFALESIQRNERSPDTAWFPILWPVKVAMAVGILLLCIQGISEVFKAYYAATKGRWPT